MSGQASEKAMYIWEHHAFLGCVAKMTLVAKGVMQTSRDHSLANWLLHQLRAYTHSAYFLTTQPDILFVRFNFRPRMLTNLIVW
ncbi:MAG: hypothetical protein ACJ8BW_39395 [Ktedonobacteraceae bacterium]|jgi:hypothetical protein